MKVTTCLLILLLISTIQTKITLNQLKKMSQDQLSDGQMVEVSHSSDATDHQDTQRQYFVIKVANRNKKIAYQTMQDLIDRAVKTLISIQLIPDSDSLVKSKTKPQYMTKKRQWSFSTIFVLLGSSKQLKQAQVNLRRYGIQKLSARPSINFLNQKIRALEVFTRAKSKLQKVLQKFPGFRIKQIESIDLESENLPNQKLIEKQIEEQFSDSEQNMQESKLMQDSETQVRSSISLKVLFEVTDEQYKEDDSGEMDILLDQDSDDTEEDETEGQSEDI